jgi:hypothetical protein
MKRVMNLSPAEDARQLATAAPHRGALLAIPRRGDLFVEVFLVGGNICFPRRVVFHSG